AISGPTNLPSPAGLTRGSIFFVRTSLRRGWIAGSSPAMTTAISASSSPAAPALAPGRGGGAGVALEEIPFQRDGVRGGLARRERLGREIVDGDGGGDGVGGGAQLVRLGLVDQTLLPRLLDVADVRRVQALAQRLRRNHAREGALEPREALVADAVEDVDG